MATWISAVQRTLLGSDAASYGIGSMSTIYVHSLDHYTRVRVLAGADSSSFRMTFAQGQDSGYWLSIASLAVSSSAAYEFDAYGRVGKLAITMGASASMLRAYIYAVPI
jgi:hypothetical protein